VPAIIPINKAKAKSESIFPPKKYKAKTGRTVVNAVFIVLDKDWLIPIFIKFSNGSLVLNFIFSLSLSKITMVLFKEYPIMVKTAAITEIVISFCNKEKIPKTIKQSCKSANIETIENLNSNLIVIYRMIPIKAKNKAERANFFKFSPITGPTVSTRNTSKSVKFSLKADNISFLCSESIFSVRITNSFSDKFWIVLWLKLNSLKTFLTSVVETDLSNLIWSKVPPAKSMP